MCNLSVGIKGEFSDALCARVKGFGNQKRFL